MARRSAMLVLAVVVLWAVSPALACLAAPPCHKCCQAMMDDDGATMAAQPCCQLQSSDTAVPSDRDATTEVSSGASQALVVVDLPDLSAAATLVLNPSKAPPPRWPSGAGTILRI